MNYQNMQSVDISVEFSQTLPTWPLTIADSIIEGLKRMPRGTLGLRDAHLVHFLIA